MYRVRAFGDVFSEKIILKCDGFREAIFGPKTSLQRFRPKNVKILICFTFAFAVHRHRWFQAHPELRKEAALASCSKFCFAFSLDPRLCGHRPQNRLVVRSP